MKSTVRSWLTLVIAMLALVLTVSGTAYAVAKSNGDSIIKKHSLSGNRLKNDAVTGKQLKDPALAPIALGATWVPATTFSLRDVGFRKDAAGFVHLQGAVTRTSGTSTLIGTLPAGARPKNYTYFPIYTSGATFGSIYIAANGGITLFSGNAGFVSLEGVSFYPDL